jgi:hypothetical protein
LARVGASTISLVNFWFSRSRFDLLARDTNLQIAKTWESEAIDFLFGNQLVGFISIIVKDLTFSPVLSSPATKHIGATG